LNSSRHNVRLKTFVIANEVKQFQIVLPAKRDGFAALAKTKGQITLEPTARIDLHNWLIGFPRPIKNPANGWVFELIEAFAAKLIPVLNQTRNKAPQRGSRKAY
jgi:hypothetical protein